MCMLDDAEPWGFQHEENRKARKEHRCVECRRTIHPGETYRHGVGMLDGYWTTYRTCAHCKQALRWLWRVCNGYLIEMAEEDLYHHIRGEEEGELSSSHLVRLVRWMDADWRTRAGELRPVAQVEELVDRALDHYEKKERAWTHRNETTMA